MNARELALPVGDLTLSPLLAAEDPDRARHLARAVLEGLLYALRANYGFDGLTFEALKGFRSLPSKLTGHGESHLNPEGVLLSNGPLGSALPQSSTSKVSVKVSVTLKP